MTNDKKQKMLLGLLSVLILGAGSWWMFRDTGSKTQQVATTGASEKKKRRTADTEKKKTSRKTRKKATAKTETRERKTREVAERKTSAKKRRGKSKSKRKKKKDTQPPAAFLPPGEEWFEELELEKFDASDFRPPVFA